MNRQRSGAEIERLGLSDDPLYKIPSYKADGESAIEGLSNYKVYRSTSENGSYSLVNTASSTNYTDTGRTNGTMYWYYVTAVYSSPSGESNASNKVSAVPQGSTNATQLTVNGSAVNGSIGTSGEADWYYFVTSQSGDHVMETHGSMDTYMHLYRSDRTTEIIQDDDSGEGTCSKITYSLSSGTTYYVKVRAYDASATGSYSVDVKGPGAATFNPPRNLTATAGNQQVSLSWSAPSNKPQLGDEPAEKRAEIERLGLSDDPLYKIPSYKADGESAIEGLSNYKVYRSTSENGSYSLVNTASSTNYTDTGRTNGTMYWYYVTAVYSSPSGESNASNKVSAVPQGSTNATQLTVNGSAVNGSIGTSGEADWYYFVTSQSGDHVMETHGSMDTYMHLYRSDRTTEIIQDDDSGEGTCSKITYSLSSGTTYYVKVRAYDASATGSYSVDVKGPGAATFNPPRNLTATAGNQQVSLSWSAPSNKPQLGDEPAEKRAEIERLGLSEDPLYKIPSYKADGESAIEGLSNYKVYRSTSENGSYSLVNTASSTNYTDTGRTNGTMYWYYVTAVYSSPSGESNASNKVSAVPQGSTNATQLTVNGSAVNGSIGTSGEADWYYFVTSQSGDHVMETHGSMDTYMHLYRSDRTTEIIQDDDSGEGTCSKITYSLSSGTTYYVKVRAYDASATGSYSVDVKGPGAATFNPPRNLTATAGNQQVSLSWECSIE